MWLIWKARNERVFENASVTSDQLRLRVHFWIAGVRETMKAYSQSISNTTVRRRESLLSWIHPPDDWVKVNTDGSVRAPDNLAAAGGFVRNSHGRILGAFSANLGSCSVMRAELRGADLGLQLAWNLGVKKVILELDSRAAVQSINGEEEFDSRHGPILFHIRQMMQKNWNVKVQHSYRETNRVADLLANWGHDLRLGVHQFSQCPPHIAREIVNDCIRVAFPRLISINS
ncbi:Putative ribonuclease H protein At1g65750 [Linum perenne]